MEVRELDIPGAWEIIHAVHGDSRGLFFEWLTDHEFRAFAGHRLDVRQANCSVSSAGVASIGGLQLGSLSREGSAVIATVPQGRTLRDLLKPFQLNGNKPVGGLVMFDKRSKPITIEGLDLTVVGPEKARLDKLQDDCDKKIKPLLKKNSQGGGP